MSKSVYTSSTDVNRETYLLERNKKLEELLEAALDALWVAGHGTIAEQIRNEISNG